MVAIILAVITVVVVVILILKIIPPPLCLEYIQPQSWLLCQKMRCDSNCRLIVVIVSLSL